MRKLFILAFLLLITAPAWALVPNETSKNTYVGNSSTTVFPYTFRILASGEIAVYVDNVRKTLTTHYTVSGVGVDGGGSITFLTAPPTSSNVVFTRDVPFTQTTDYIPNQAINATVLETNVDKLTMITQQLREVQDRSLTFPFGPPSPSNVFPLPGAGQCIAWDGAGASLTTVACGSGGGGGSGNVSGSGVAGRVAFWNGTELLASDPQLLWNNTEKVLVVGAPVVSEFTAHTDRRITTFQTANDLGKAYLGIGVQVKGVGDTTEYAIPGPLNTDRVAISGYVFSQPPDAGVPHLGGDFGLVVGALDTCGPSCVQNYAVGVNVHQAAGDPGPLGREVVGIAMRLDSSLIPDTSHGSVGMLFVTPSNPVRWYRGIHFDPNTIHGSSTGGLGGIYFDGSQPDVFITMRPSVTDDGVAVRIVDQSFSVNTLALMNSGRVLSRRSSTNCTTPSFAFNDDTDTGMCSSGEDVLNFVAGGLVGLVLGNGGITYSLNGIEFGNLTNTNSVWLKGGVVGTSFSLTLPTADGSAGTCLSTNGAGVLGWAACSAGAGGGITSLGGQVGATQTFTNDTNVQIASAANAHVLTWSGSLAAGRGGTGRTTLTANGVLYGAGTSAVGMTAEGATGTVLIGNTGSGPNFSGDVIVNTLTAVTQVAAPVIATFPLDATNTGTLRLRELASNGMDDVGFKAPNAVAAPVIWTLPATDGSAGQVLSTNGGATLSWVNPASGAVSGSGTSGQITYWTSPTAVTGGGNFLWDQTNKVQRIISEAQNPIIRLRGYQSGGSANPLLQLFSSGGTLGSPIAIAIDQPLGRIQFAGHNGTTDAVGASINATTTSNWGADNAARLDFDVTPIGGTIRTTRLQINDEGITIRGPRPWADIRAFGASTSASAAVNRAAIQAAIDAVAAYGVVYIPSGSSCYVIDAALSITKGIRIFGDGTPSITDLEINNIYGSCIALATNNQVGININTKSKVMLQDFAIVVGGPTGTIGIRVDGPTGNLEGAESFTMERMLIRGQERGVEILASVYTKISQTLIWNTSGIGILVENHHNSDQGDHHLWANTFLGQGVALYLRSGGMMFFGNKMLGYNYGIVIDAGGITQATGNIQISGNSIEGFNNAGIYVERTSGVLTLGNISVTGNEIASVQSANHYGFLIEANGSTFTTNTSITGNVFRFLSNGVAIGGGTGIDISGNSFADTTIAIASSTAGVVTIGSNTYASVTTPLAINSTTTTIRLPATITFATFASVIANGSIVYCEDCTVTASCGSGGTGAIAKRLNGAWVCN